MASQRSFSRLLLAIVLVWLSLSTSTAIFVDGRDNPNLAAKKGSTTTIDDLIQAVLTGSGGALASFSKNPNKIDNVGEIDVDSFSVRLTTAPAATPASAPAPVQALVPTPAPVTVSVAVTAPAAPAPSPVVVEEPISAPQRSTSESDSGFILSSLSFPMGTTGGTAAPTTTATTETTSTTMSSTTTKAATTTTVAATTTTEATTTTVATTTAMEATISTPFAPAATTSTVSTTVTTSTTAPKATIPTAKKSPTTIVEEATTSGIPPREPAASSSSSGSVALSGSTDSAVTTSPASSTTTTTAAEPTTSTQKSTTTVAVTSTTASAPTKTAMPSTTRGSVSGEGEANSTSAPTTTTMTSTAAIGTTATVTGGFTESPFISQRSATASTTMAAVVTNTASTAGSSASARGDRNGGKQVSVSTADSVTATAVWNGSGPVVVSGLSNDNSDTEDEFNDAVESIENAEPTAEAETVASAEGSPGDGELALVPKGPGRPPVEPVSGNEEELGEEVTAIADASAFSSHEMGEWNPKSSGSRMSPEHEVKSTPGTESAVAGVLEAEPTQEATDSQPESLSVNESEPTQDASIDEATSTTGDAEPTHYAIDVEGAVAPETSLFPDDTGGVVSIITSLSSIFDETPLASDEPSEVIGPILVESDDSNDIGDVSEGDVAAKTDAPLLGAFLDSFNFAHGNRGDREAPEVSDEAEVVEASSEYPEGSEEPDMYPSSGPETLVVELFVNHPVSFSADVLAEDIRQISNEFIVPEVWTILNIIPLSKFSKFTATFDRRVLIRQSETNSGKNTFEMALTAVCPSDAGCREEMDDYLKFVRDESMDKALVAHDYGHVNVYVKGDRIVDRADAVNSAAGAGLGVGVIAGIAVGAVALVSLLVLGVVFMVKRNGGRIESSDAEGGYDDDDEYDERHNSDPYQMPEEQGSFLISNFGGSFCNASGMIPWMNEPSGRGNGPGELSSNSFISIDTAATEEIENNNMSEYRFDETTSSSSGSEMEDLGVNDGS